MSVKSYVEPPTKPLHNLKDGRAGNHSVRGSGGRSGALLWHILALLSLAVLIVLVNPRGYTGGGYDDGRYLAAATEWAVHGPVLGQDHWALRWPLVLPTAGIIRLFGLDFHALMVPGFLSFLAISLVTYFGVRSAVNERAAFLAALGVMATPGFAIWSTALYLDLFEAALWSGAFWCLWRATHALEAMGQTRAMIAMGAVAGFAVCVRETSIALGLGLLLASLYLPRLPLRLWVIAGVSAAILPVSEYVILWVASGDPLYRLHVDMGHLGIQSDDIRGGAAAGQSAILNSAVMERWDGAGPVHWHWLVDTYINAFLNIYYGLNFVGLAVLGVWYRRCRRREGNALVLPGRGTRGLLPALCALGFANIVWNFYVLTLNPSDRMFMPATMCAAIIVAVLANRMWLVRGVRRLVGAMMLVKIAATLIVADTIPNYRNAAVVAARIAPTQGRVHTGWLGWSQMVFTDPALRSRLDLTPTPVGGVFIVYSNRRELWTEHLPHGRWRVLRIGYAGHMPWTFRAVNVLTAGLGLDMPIRFKDVEVRLFRRLPDKAGEDVVAVEANGRVMPVDARSE